MFASFGVLAAAFFHVGAAHDVVKRSLRLSSAREVEAVVMQHARMAIDLCVVTHDVFVHGPSQLD